ncbi:MAG: ATP synthase subunit I [Acidimicrobiia bacterium]
MSNNVLLSRFDERSPEGEIARDMAKRGIKVAPVLILIGGLIWGVPGALSTAFGVGLVILNFLLSAAMLTYAGRISLAFVMGAALFGYILRLGLITVAVLLVKDFSWVNLIAMGLTLIITHLGLLFWEARYVSASLAYPGLKPTASATSELKE